MPPWYKRTLASGEGLGRANTRLENARTTKDPRRAKKLCDEAKEALERIDSTKSIKDRDRIVAVYREHAKLLERLGFNDEAQASYAKANELSGTIDQVASTATPSPSIAYNSASSSGSARTHSRETIIATIFTKDCPPSTSQIMLPGPDERLVNTRQLALCLSLLQIPSSSLDSLEPSTRAWLRDTEKNQDEKDRLRALATDLIRALARDELKNAAVIAEVVCLAPALEKSDFRSLLSMFVNSIKDSLLLDVQALEGLAHLIQSATPGYLDADDLVKILALLSTRLQETFQQSPQHIYDLTITISRVLDAMADSNIQGLDRVNLHEPLLSYLGRLKADKDPYIVYQAAYTFQALLCVPDDEEPWQAVLRRSGAVIKGVGGLASAIKGLNVSEFMNGLSTIQEGFQGAGQIIGLVQDAYNGVTTLTESGQGLLESLKDGLSFSHKRAWYAALRGADSMIRDGELTKLKTLICEAPCRRDLAFQWGICERLGNLASDPLSNDDSRKDAISFLGEMYWNDQEWGQEPRIKQCILDILLQLSQAPGHNIKVSVHIVAKDLLKDLAADGDENKQGLCLATILSGPSPHPRKVASPPSNSSFLIDQIQNKPSLEPALRKYQRRRLQEQEQRHAVYILPQAKATRESSNDDLFDLTTKVNEFITSDRDGKVLLLLGDSGAGKSTFNLELERNLWKAYNSDKIWIPVFVTLPAIDKPEEDLIAKQLRRYNFSEDQINELKEYRQFVLICDGYDECQKKDNLYNDNRLNQPGEWKVKMVISCRSEFLGADYRVFFQPGGRNDRKGVSQLQEAVVAPFTLTKINDYIRSYVVNNQSAGEATWTVEDYESTIKNIPNLQELVSNPFLLSLAIEVLPRLVDLSKDFTSNKISRVILYDQFVEQWAERGQIRLIERSLAGDDHTAFEILSEDGFTRNAIGFIKDLAVAIFDKQDGRPVVEYSPIRDKSSWKSAFFGHGDGKNLLRETCPLSRTGNQYRFIHRSVLEYGLARAVYEPTPSRDDQEGSAEQLDAQKGFYQDELAPNTLSESPLFRKSFIHEPSIINFLSERAQQSIEFKNRLHGFIDRSKTEDRFSQAAANAITILVRAGVSFNSADLCGIRIQGADLRHGHFDYAQLQGADLRDTNLQNIWLRHADLNHAVMDGVNFCEWSYLQLEFEVTSCVYSPKGTFLAVGCDNGSITLFESSTWRKIHTLEGHNHRVTSVVFSPNGHQIASSSFDGTARMWDVKTGSCGIVLRRRDGCLYDPLFRKVEFSPDGHQLATCSSDGVIQLWDADTGAPGFVLKESSEHITSMSYSPDGSQIVFCDADGSIKLWDVQDGSPALTLWTRTCEVSCVAFSPRGHLIASSSNNTIVNIRDIGTGSILLSLEGHAHSITRLIFSPDGGQLACCIGGTVRLWDTQTGAPGPTLSGHTGQMTCIAFSPNSQQLVSGSDDRTVRIWDVQTVVTKPILGNREGSVQEVALSPSSHQIALRHWGGALQLWDAETGPSGKILNVDDSEATAAMNYSHNGEQIACASDMGIHRLYDTKAGALKLTLEYFTGQAVYAVYSPDGHQIAYVTFTSTVRLWNTITGESGFIFKFKMRINPQSFLVFSPSGQQILFGSANNTVEIWNTQTGKLDALLKGHTDIVERIIFSPNRKQIATASSDYTVRLWDAQTGAPGLILEGHTSHVSAIEYSPCGLQIASGSADETIRVWDVRTGEPGVVLRDHGDWVKNLKYSPNGEQIASVTREQRLVRIWDTTSGQLLAIMDGFLGEITSLSWMPNLNGACLVTGCEDGSVRMWQLVESNGKWQMRLRWSTRQDALVLTNASIENVRGLSDMNIQLLKQRGAVGVPDSA